VLTVTRLSGSAKAILDYAEAKSEPERHRGIEDYLAASSGAQGRFVGELANLLGLAQYDSQMVEKLLAGCEPKSGEFLVETRPGYEHAPGLDLTFSAPKSVTVLWATSGRETRQKIESIHRHAVNAVLKVVHQEFMWARRGHAGEERLKAQGLSVVYDHFTSRPVLDEATGQAHVDPQLHSHAILMNLALGADGKFSTIDAGGVFANVIALGAAYRAELARGLENQLGLAVERDGDSIRLVAPESVHKQAKNWSARAGQIRRALLNAGVDPNAPSIEERENARLQTRAEKDYRVSPDALQSMWREEALALGIAPVTIAQCRDMALERALSGPRKTFSADHILAKATAHESVFQRRHVFKQIALEVQTIRDMGAQEILAETDKLLDQDERVVNLDRHREIFTTTEILDLERRTDLELGEMASVRGCSIDERAIPRAIAATEKSIGRALNSEQKHAIRHVCAEGGIKLIQGHAGAGKTTVAYGIREVFERSGYRVLGAAPSAKAAKELADGSGILSSTIHRLLTDLEPWYDRQGHLHPAPQRLDSKNVLVVDEAAMIDSRTAARLVEKVHAADAKLILIGDTAQLPSVGPGAMFRTALERQGGVELATVLRQRQEWARDAAEAQRVGNARKALEAFQRNGNLHIAQTKDAAFVAALAAWEQHFSPQRARETLMVASTRADVRALNELAREKLIQKGELPGPEVQIEVTSGRGDRGVTREIREGERIILKRNDRKLGVRNGEIGTVKSIGIVRGTPALAVRLDDGRDITLMTAEYSAFDYGYAATVHAAQGATLEHCVALIDSSSQPRRELAYVALSRAREATEVVVTADSARQDFAELSPQVQAQEPAPNAIEKTIAGMEKAEEKKSTLDFDPDQKSDLKQSGQEVIMRPRPGLGL